MANVELMPEQRLSSKLPKKSGNQVMVENKINLQKSI